VLEWLPVMEGAAVSGPVLGPLQEGEAQARTLDSKWPGK